MGNAKIKHSNWLVALGGVILYGVIALGLVSCGASGNGGEQENLAGTQTALAEVIEHVTETAHPTTVPVSTDTPVPTETPEPTAAPTGIPGLVLIPAGEFQMGSEDGYDNERPVHTVYLDAYSMDGYEVTNARYAECVSAGKCSSPAYDYYGNSSYTDHPVVGVDWNQAQAYCQWRGGDLPTEAQWEKAARGGLVGKIYPWSDEDPVCQKGAKNEAQFDICEPRGTVAVGSFSPNGYGLYDMAGNVGEWVLDWYQADYYSSQSTWSNPLGPSSGSDRVLRGGSWYSSVFNLHSADRDRLAPSGRDHDIGFRCSRSVTATSGLEPTPTEAPISASSTGSPSELVDEKGVTMALIPAGEFQMGSEDGYSDQQPVHTVYLDAFTMDIYEVTNARYAECVSAGACPRRHGKPVHSRAAATTTVQSTLTIR